MATFASVVAHVKNSVIIVSIFYFVLIWSLQVSASLLDPSLISRELQSFARDALGVEEMQVKLIS